jgi:hypothetical protein
MAVATMVWGNVSNGLAYKPPQKWSVFTYHIQCDEEDTQHQRKHDDSQADAGRIL